MNVISNPGFESGLWPESSGGSIDTAVKHSGNQSAKMVGGTADEYQGTNVIPVNPNNVYELSVWVKTANISKPDGVSINVLMVNDSSVLGWYNTLKLIKTGGTQDWTQYSVDISNLTSGTTGIRVYARVDGNMTGTAWFDDAELKQKDLLLGVNGPVGNIFTSGEPLKMNLSMQNLDVQNKNIHIAYSVNDYNNIPVTTGSFDATVAAGQTSCKELDFSSVCGYGVYDLAVNVTGDNGYTNLNEVFPFSKVLTSGENAQDGIFGVNTHFQLNRGDIEKNLTIAQEAGIKWIRDGMDWPEAETVKGVINILPSWDQYVDTALAKGIKPLIILGSGNSLYDGIGAPYTDEGIAAYANYAGKIAAHFKGKADHFEIWNEYNLAGFNPDMQPPETYAKMLKAAYTAIKAANPDAVVIGCGTSGTDINWISRVLAAGGYDYMDAVSIHPYCYPNSPEDGNFIANLQNVKALFKNYGPEKPIWVTEIGWSTQNTENGGITELQSGADAVRMYTLALASGLVDKIFWYDLQNDGVTNYVEDNFGLIRCWQNETVPWAAKVNYAAYCALTSKISDADFVKAYTPGDDTYAYRFHRNSDNKDVLVLWKNSGSKSLLLNLGASGAEAYDLFGNGSTITGVNGTITLTVSDKPVYLEGNFSPDIQITDPLSISASPVLKQTVHGTKWDIDFNIKSNMSTASTGKVTILDSTLLAGDAAEKPFAIEAGNTTTVSYDFPGIPEEKLYDLKAQISLDNGTSTIIERKISFCAAQKAYTAPTIDGVISQNEWDGARPITIDQASQTHLSNWGGVNDLSGTGYVKWDNDNFYLAFEAKDNVHDQNGTADDIWQGDSIQFVIDPGRNSGLHGLGYNEIGIALNSTTSNVIKWRWAAPAGKATGAMNSINCQIKRDDSSGKTTYELAIPWSDLLPDGITADTASDFGFSMLVNDNDGSGRRGWMEYMSGIGANKDPFAFGDLVLTDLPALESVMASADKGILKTGETASVSVIGITESGSQADLSQAQIVYTSDNERVATVDGNGTITAAGEGTANITASVTWGGVTQDSSTQVIVDDTPPVTMAAVSPDEPGGQNGWYINPVTVSLAASDEMSGVAKTEYSLDGMKTWQAYAGPVIFDQDGKYAFYYRSADNAGNVEQPKCVSFDVDVTAPSIAISVPTAASYSDADYLTPRFTVTDGTSGVDESKTVVTLDGQIIRPGITVPLYTLPLGTHTLTVTATDLAGNTFSQSVTFETATGIASLKSLVALFADNGFIHQNGITYSLQEKLNTGALRAFIHEVNAQNGKHISAYAAQYLLRDARWLLKHAK